MFDILLIILAALVVIMASGGLFFYFKIYKKLAKEFGEFVSVTFNALKDKKLTIAEKEQILKEWSDLKPIIKELKDKYALDVKDLSDDVKKLYESLKESIKK
jgi:hypothetical protein